MCTCPFIQLRGPPWVLFLTFFSPCLLRQDVSETGLKDVGKFVWATFPENCLSLSPQHGDYKCVLPCLDTLIWVFRTGFCLGAFKA